MYRLEFHISYTCPNRCIFCSEHDQLCRHKDYFVPADVIARELKVFAGPKKKFLHVTFTGGEPTLHPHFIELLRLAKSIGYKTNITTNGGMLARNAFARDALPFIDEICFSLHGHTPLLHDFHTQNNKSFANLMQAMKNFEQEKHECFGMVNVVVTRHNIAFLEDIMQFVSRFKKIRHILYSNLAPEGQGLRSYAELAVGVSAFRRAVPGLVAKNNDALALRFFGLPLCVLGRFYEYSNDLHWTSRLTKETWREGKKKFIKTTRSYKPVRGRRKTVICQNCKKKASCGGVFDAYYKLYGTAGLCAFTRP